MKSLGAKNLEKSLGPAEFVQRYLCCEGFEARKMAVVRALYLDSYLIMIYLDEVLRSEGSVIRLQSG
jgi:hypothetical protein